jgi:outer membrane murein-binding lipoprotein Lpp
LDEELRQCERKRKGWVAATVVGGVGVVGTGIAALVQNSKIQDKKAELKRVEGDVASAKEDVNRAQERLDKMQ